VSKLGKPSAFKATVIAALLATALGAQAAGLGKLTVYSGIGQPLSAEVALTASKEELASLSAKLASHEAFREAGIEFAPALSSVRFNIAKLPNGQSVLKLTSDRPVDEPFLHFLVELNWSSGRMMREYTFLLDPPEMLRVAKPASVVAPTTPAIKALPAAPTAQPAAAPVAAKPRAELVAAGDYEVKRGDTLSRIARETKAESVSLDQMLVALFDSNRDAFDGNNMNRLRSGKILRIPEAGQAAQVDPAEARKLVIGQAAEFNAYRRQLAEAAGKAPAVAESAPRQQVTGTIKPQVEEKAPPVVTKDKLEVSRTEAPKTAQAVGGSSLEEDLIARDKALREASERIAMLEKNIENLKHLVEIKSQTGTKLQQESQAAAKPAEAPPAPVADAQKEKPATETAPAKPAEAPAPAVETPKPAESAPAAVAPPTRKPAAPPPPPPEPSFVEENPQLVYGGGGLLALLLSYLGYSSWRRKQQAAAQAEEYAEPFAEQAEQPAAAAPIPPENLEASEISIQSDFGESGALTAEEIVDPVAEADVLMAYGRDKQAEEILLDGMKNDPARTAIHMKLLELYAKQEDLAQFETVATELHKQNNGRGAEWEKALSMAHALGLSGGIFIGAVVPAVAEAAESAPQPAEEPAAAEAVAGAAAPEETASLDFDLDLGTTSKVMEPPATAVAEPEAQPAGATETEAAGLDFDFDLATPETGAAVEAAVEKSIDAAATENAVDFSFDLDLGTASDTGAVAAAVQEEAGAEEPTQTMPSEAPMTEEAAGAGEIKFDFDLDLDSGSPAATAEHAEKEAAAALPDINLDLDIEPSAPEPVASAAAAADVDLAFDLAEVAPAGGEAEVVAAASETDNPEVATKLELAQAYEEMGDLEGTRELLNEVLNEGSAAQREQARAKLDQLSV